MDVALHNLNQWRSIANIAFPAWLDRALRVIIVTPFMRKVHHSRWQPEDHTLTGLLATPLKQVQRATGEAPANATTNS